MISRRDFLKGLGVGALAVAAPLVGRRIWQVHRDAPVRSARIYNVDEVRASFDGVEFPPFHYNCRSVVRDLKLSAEGELELDQAIERLVLGDQKIYTGALVGLDECGLPVPAVAGSTPLGLVTRVDDDGSFMVDRYPNLKFSNPQRL